MQTAKQVELIQRLTSQLNTNDKKMCEPMIEYLLKLGYTPKKHKKSSFAVAFEKNGRLISKMEIERHSQKLVFFLRFSVCENYSKVFEDAVAKRPESWIKRNQEYVNHDINDCCGNCRNMPRLYHFINSNGDTIARCGGYTLEIPEFHYEDVPEALKLIKKQDEYFTLVLSN